MQSSWHVFLLLIKQKSFDNKKVRWSFWKLTLRARWRKRLHTTITVIVTTSSLSWCPSLAQLLHFHDYWSTACSCFSVRCLALSGGSRCSDTQQECQWRTAKSVGFETTVSFSAWVTAVPNSSSILDSLSVASWMLRLIDQGSRHR
jgi:hypothetical protein